MKLSSITGRHCFQSLLLEFTFLNLFGNGLPPQHPLACPWGVFVDILGTVHGALSAYRQFCGERVAWQAEEHALFFPGTFRLCCGGCRCLSLLSWTENVFAAART